MGSGVYRPGCCLICGSPLDSEAETTRVYLSFRLKLIEKPVESW